MTSHYRPDLNDIDDDLARDEHAFCGFVEGQPKWMRFGCRNIKNVTCQIALRPLQKNSMDASWAFNGNFEKPTIDPSINCEQVCGWHGHIIDGEYKP